MDNQRFFIWAVFGFMCLLNYQAWIQQDVQNYQYMGRSADTAQEITQNNQERFENNVPEIIDIQSSSTITEARLMQSNDTLEADIVKIKTDVLEISINLVGATIQEIKLLNYPILKDKPDDLVELMNQSVNNYGLIQSGIRASDNKQEANHLVKFSSGSKNYELNFDGELIVPFIWESGDGVSVEKQFILKKGNYNIRLEQIVRNDSDQEWRGAQYSQLVRRVNKDDRSVFDVESFSFDGPIIFDGDKSEKVKPSDLLEEGPLTYSALSGWIGTIQHHFVTAIIPGMDNEFRYQINADNDKFIASLIGPAQLVYPGENIRFKTNVYTGPKLQSQMEEITPTLKLTVDYGILTLLSDPLFWLLSLIYSYVNNWGFSIILVTVFIKLLFYKLTEKSGHSMAKMRALAPRLKSIQERYKDNREQLGRATMELYKREKVNPAAGCVPMLIQMPFFLAFYWVLLESVEMRQAPFIFWLTDLSSRDPFFVLPLMMAGAMLVQTKLNPAPADPMQAKVMQIMPIMFSVMFAFFPSGLVLYWVTNTILSIMQQWMINKKLGVNATIPNSSG
tara:strand:- start:1538 stop:3226 length:1689 start_codon:yes stop_codon:yes gene_type:complete